MAKLTGAKKKAFLERMAKGRRKAKRANPKRKKAAKKSPNPKFKKTSTRVWEVYKIDTGRTAELAQGDAKKNEVLARWKKAGYSVSARLKNPTIRRAKKVIGKAFTRPVAAQWAKEKRAKARTAKKTRTGTRRALNPKRRRRNSGEDEAAAMFETFHQMPPKRIIDYEEIVRFPGNFAEIGRPLKELRVYLDDANPDFSLTRFGDCQVVCTPDGSNIYFVGGNQSIDLNSLDITSDKDTIELGPCTYIMYHTVKGFHDFEPIDYWHRFGEEDGVFPRLGYDRLNKRLFLIGGNYQAKREGIVN